MDTCVHGSDGCVGLTLPQLALPRDDNREIWPVDEVLSFPQHQTSQLSSHLAQRAVVDDCSLRDISGNQAAWMTRPGCCRGVRLTIPLLEFAQPPVQAVSGRQWRAKVRMASDFQLYLSTHVCEKVSAHVALSLPPFPLSTMLPPSFGLPPAPYLPPSPSAPQPSKQVLGRRDLAVRSSPLRETSLPRGTPSMMLAEP